MRYRHYKGRKHSAELLDSILNGSTEYAIIATDLNDKIILWNRGAELIYGYNSFEMVGKQSPMELHTIDAADKDILFMGENTFRTSIFDREMMALRKDGTALPVSVTVTPRLNAHDEIIGFLIISRDITKLKIQDAYRDALLEISYAVNSSFGIEDLCQAVINVINKLMEIDVVFICLFDFMSNDFKICAQTGLCDNYCSHACSYQSDEDNVPAEAKDCFLTYSQLTINSGKLSKHIIWDYISDEKAKSDTEISIIHIPLISDIALLGVLHIVVPTKRKDFLIKNTQVLSLIANEIAAGLQRKRLVEEIKQYADNLEKMVEVRTEQLRDKDAQLVQSGKLATLGEMASGIAHEMNQPLGSITLMAQGILMANRRGKLNDTLLKDKLNTIIDQVERINKLISHLRAFSRQSSEVRQEVNVNNPLTDTFKLIGQQLKNRNILVELALDRNIPPVLADHNKLEQVFLNIIGNARDALDDFEKTVDKFKLLDERPEWVDGWRKKIAIKTYREYDFVIIEIADTGSGIPPAIIEKIFEPFFTTKEVGKGTGLGLSITYGIIKEFGGTISVESEEMKGSRFIIRLPTFGVIPS
ncbi:MAG: ATP-binding protein [Clostridia bacterium]|nr:ATP-binding protein [Clostridia bacterium]